MIQIGPEKVAREKRYSSVVLNSDSGEMADCLKEQQVLDVLG